jgi:hypothetical protein
MYEPGCAKAVTKRDQEIAKAIFQMELFIFLSCHMLYAMYFICFCALRHIAISKTKAFEIPFNKS